MHPAHEVVPGPPLLILGAGASRPYSFPTSAELRQIILGGDAGTKTLSALGVPWARINGYLDERYLEEEERRWVAEWNILGRREIPEHQPVAKLFIDMAFRRWGSAANQIQDYEINDFRKLFFESQLVSIDAFAACNGGMYDLMARIAIAAIILLCEREERVADDWYQQLLSAIHRNLDRFEEHGLRVISFNYDRSFEFFFERAFKAIFQTEPDRTATLLGKIQIKHPYGSIGTLRNHHYGRLGGLTAVTEKLMMARGAANTETGWGDDFYDGVTSTTFLGFSFWPENLDVLRLGALPLDRSILATACGLPIPVQDDMRKLIPGIEFGNPKELALEFVVARRAFQF